MTKEQWQQLEECARRVAVEQTKEYIKYVIEDDTPRDERLQSREDNFAIEVIKEALNRYRLEPAESRIKTYVDWLIKRHAEFEKIMQTDDTFRIRHNVIVLEYIIKKPMTHVQIEKKLGISDGTFKRYIDTGIRELADILFMNYIGDISE